MQHPIKVIAFDLDNTLWEVDPVIMRAEKIVAEWFQEAVPGFEYGGATLGKHRQLLLSEKPDLAFRLTEFRHQLMHRALKEHGITDEDAHQHATKAMDVFLEARNQVDFYEGVLETLAHLRSTFLLGSLTNGNADINRLGLGEYFSFAFTAEDIGAPKPAPDLFLKALEHTGCDPHEMVYVGDDPIKDVEAAAALGLKTIWVKRVDETETCEPDRVIRTVTQLPEAIASLHSDRRSN